MLVLRVLLYSFQKGFLFIWNCSVHHRFQKLLQRFTDSLAFQACRCQIPAVHGQILQGKARLLRQKRIQGVHPFLQADILPLCGGISCCDPVGPVDQEQGAKICLSVLVQPAQQEGTVGVDLAVFRAQRSVVMAHQRAEAVPEGVVQMQHFRGSAGDFFQGVEIQETFEKDFRPLAEDERFTPVMLILILDLYFCLSTITMVEETPEVQELAKLLKLKSSDIVMVLDVFQTCDPYLNREASVDSALLLPCQQIWQRYGNMEPHVLAAYAEELKEYFKS